MGKSEIYYNTSSRLADQISRVLALIGFLTVVLGAANILAESTELSIIQPGFLFLFTALTLNRARRYQMNGTREWYVRFIYMWGIASSVAFLVRLVLLLHVSNAIRPVDLGWALGPMNFGFITIEPLWMFLLVGLIAAIIGAIATAVPTPGNKRLRYTTHSFIGAVITALLYADFRDISDSIPVDWIGIRQNWTWSTLWSDVYNIIIPGSGVQSGTFTMQSEWGIMFIVFLSVSWITIRISLSATEYFYERTDGSSGVGAEHW